jgi:RNA polymerase sigma-70 factor (ECF subfamily)
MSLFSDSQLLPGWANPVETNPATGPVPTTALSGVADPVDALVARCLSGEEAAYHALYDHFAGYIYRLCYGLLQNKEDAEEVLQDAFEYAFRRLDHYDPRKAGLKTWLYQIAVSRCRNKRRRRFLPTFSLQQVTGHDLQDPAATQPDAHLILNERQRTVWHALGKLSPKLRETAVLRYYAELTYPEIGHILGISPKTAESRMRLAHKALKAFLEEKP